METQTFDNVWYRNPKKRWRLRVFDDTGKLIVHDDSLEFQGKKQTMVITQVKRISSGKQGTDFVHEWVVIEYGEGPAPSIAVFTDGSQLGWGGTFGGTKRILAAVQHLAK